MSEKGLTANGQLKPLRPYQLETIAKLACMDANSPEQIAQTVGLPVKRIMGLLSGKNKTFQRLYDHYHQIVMREHTGATMKMVELLPKAHIAVEKALDSEDTKLASDTAFKLYERVLPNPNAKTATQVGEINVTFNNPQATTILNETVVGVGSMLSDLKAHMAKEINPITHELHGLAALSRPASQLEVGNGEAMPSIEDAQDAVVMVKMPQERW